MTEVMSQCNGAIQRFRRVTPTLEEYFVFVEVYRGLSCVINGDKPRETSIEELMSYILLPLKYMSDEGFEPPISHEKQVLGLSP